MHGRRTARWRLTLWYGLLVFATGASLLGLSYLLVRHSLTVDPAELRSAIGRRIDRTIVEVEPGTDPSFGNFIPGNDPSFVVALSGAQRGLVDEALHRLLVQSGIALSLMSVASLGVGWYMAGRALRPLNEITAAARRLSQDTLHERIALQGPDDELKLLADTFDAMLSRLDVAFAAQREFVANASHELRTPLTIIRTELDVTLADPDASAAELRAMGETIRLATVRCERLIGSLLTLARADGRPRRELVDVADLAAAAVAESATAARARGLSLSLSLETAPVLGDRALLERLAGNLIENATRHNHDGGWMRVGSAVAEDRVVLTVANGGPVVQPADLETLFQRFRRLDPSRSRATGGFGLGLSIVRAVAKAHGGSVTAQAGPAGGLTVEVVLPRAVALPPEVTAPAGSPDRVAAAG